MKIKNVEVYFSVLLFGLTYCILAMPSIFMRGRFFDEYGFFENGNAKEQFFLLIVLYLTLFFLVFLSQTNKFVRVPRISIPFGNALLFCLYLSVYVCCFFDFTIRNSFQLYFTTNFSSALSTIGYFVAHSSSKFSFGYIYISSFIFFVFVTNLRSSVVIRFISFLIININVVLLLLSGRKEQAITAICILLLFYKIKFRLRFRNIVIFSTPLLLAISICLNYVRGDISKKPIIDVLFYSQESYPVILGTYLPFMVDLSNKLWSFSDSLSSFLATTFPFRFGMQQNAVDYINETIFHEFGYGVVMSVFGYIYLYFPFSLIVVYLLFYCTNVIINSIRLIDGNFFVFSFYFFVKIFFLLRNGVVANYIFDVLVLIIFCFPLFLFKEKRGDDVIGINLRTVTL